MSYELPPIPLDLLEALEPVYKPRIPALDWTDRKIYTEAGKAELVQNLRLVYEEQQEDYRQSTLR